MTVKELKERLNKFNDNLLVMIPNPDWVESNRHTIPAKYVTQGVNELDGCIFIDSYEED